jgi:glycosyltransferase involved in cell wall biosynthesis
MRCCSNNGNIVVSEHSIKDRKRFPWKQRVYNGKTHLRIGIIGDIGLHKGSKILKNLIEHPEYKKLPINTIVIGTAKDFPASYKSDKDKLIITGRYERNKLPHLLEKYEVSVVLIPSICPETFSFTTSEALLLGYPVICFNIGAHAERVKKYNAGIVIEEISADGLLQAFKDILDRPFLIKELSTNARRYVPPTAGEHFEKILNLLDVDTSKDNMLRVNSPHCTASR